MQAAFLKRQDEDRCGCVGQGLFFTIFLASTTLSAGTVNNSLPALIPIPKTLELRESAFELPAQTQIATDQDCFETGKYLAERLRRSTGYRITVTPGENSSSPQAIIITTNVFMRDLGPEGYELVVKTNSVSIHARTSTGAFYGVQSLLQLFPRQMFSATVANGVDWQAPCLRIEDQPRFKWRGLLLDVGRHFFNKEEIKRLLGLMALHKLNTFHWHLTDREGWRIEIKRYPRLTQKGAWRSDIGFGLDRKTSNAFGADGRYGGYYTQADIREIVAYAAALHITIVPEIEMPGHSTAALDAYPEFNCSLANNRPAPQIGVYCAGNNETFEFLENILHEVFELFPGKYIHIGGDEVSKENWKNCPHCQQRMNQEGLKDAHELQSYFIRRVEKFIGSRNRTLVGWSEIRQGGLAQNAVMMDWIGGGIEAATEGHDVVMSPGGYCYFDHYQSLDYAREPVAIACYLPLREVYEFEPIPAKLAREFQHHILGGQANVWTEYIASEKYLDYMTFPRLCALAEAVWSPKESRRWGDFQLRLQSHLTRLDQLNVNYRVDTAVEIGRWAPPQFPNETATLEWDVTEILNKPDPREVIIDDKSRELTPELISEPGKCHVVFDHTRGGTLKVSSVALLENGREISSDAHPGIAGAEPRDLVSRDVVYTLSLKAGKRGARYVVQARVSVNGSEGSWGIVFMDRSVRGKAP